jgi:hypothetical protein
MIKIVVFLLFFFPSIGLFAECDDVGPVKQLPPLNSLDDHFYFYRMILIESVIFDMRRENYDRTLFNINHSLDLLEYLLGKPIEVSCEYDD